MTDIREVVSLKTFPERSTYTSSVAYGAAVEQWLGEQMQFSNSLNLSITDMNSVKNFLENLGVSIAESKGIIQTLKDATVTKAQEVANNTQTVNTKAQEVANNTNTVSLKTQEVATNTTKTKNFRDEAEAFRNQAQQVAGGDIVSSQIKFSDSKNLDEKIADLDNTYIPLIPTVTFSNCETTAKFVAKIKSLSNKTRYSVKASWDYAHNSNITDTNCGEIELAGCSIDVWRENNFPNLITIQVICPNAGASANKIFVFNDQGSDYAPGWCRVYNTKDKPTLDELGALGKTQTAEQSKKITNGNVTLAPNNNNELNISINSGDTVHIGHTGSTNVINTYKFQKGDDTGNLANIVANNVQALDNVFVSGWCRVVGDTGIYWQTHGGGWFMQDSDWIRSYGNKSIYTATKIKADAGFEDANGSLDNRYLLKSKIRLNGTTGYIDA